MVFKFGIDGDGNYGYYGADGSLIPFKKYANLDTGITLTKADRRRIHNIPKYFDHCWSIENSDGIKRVCLAIPTNGYYDTRDVIGITITELKKAMGISDSQTGVVGTGNIFNNQVKEFTQYVTFPTMFLETPSVSLSWLFGSEFTAEARDVSVNGFLLYVKWNGYGGPAATNVTWVAIG